MPKITKITKQKHAQNRYNIFLDGDFAGALNAEAMVIHHIKENIEIEPDDFRRMVEEDNQKYAFQLAVKQVAARRRTVQEVKDYLIKKELDEDIAEHAVQKLLDYGYLNDLEYAREFVSYHINAAKYGSIVLKHKMEQKGFADSDIENALKAYTNDIEYQNAKGLYEKLNKKYAAIEPHIRRQKIYRGLASKGFSFDVVSGLLSGDDS